MDKLDREIINQMQGGFPLCDHPYSVIAQQLGTSEGELIDRLKRLKQDGQLSRFGPLYNIEKMGGKFLLCALCVPERDFDAVAEQVNQFHQVAHNYQRGHRFNMWFVLATETAEQMDSTVDSIEQQIGLTVHRFPKLDEYYVGFKLTV